MAVSRASFRGGTVAVLEVRAVLWKQRVSTKPGSEKPHFGKLPESLERPSVLMKMHAL